MLRKDLPSPLAPESDEEKPKDAAKADAAKPDAAKPDAAKPDAAKAEPVKPSPVRIDLDKIERRIVALPIPTRDYDQLMAGKAGVLFVLESDASRATRPRPHAPEIRSEEAQDREVCGQRRRVRRIRERREDLLVMRQPSQPGAPPAGGPGPGAPMQYAIASASAPYKPGEGVLKLAGMDVRVDPRAEWKQMYREVWRIERSYFYDPHLHGVNAANDEKRFEKYIDGIAARADLNYVFQEMLGEFTVGHLRGGGGAMPNPKHVPGGLLGADYKIANGHYRFARVYTGENWNPQLRAPLTQPGVNVQNGEYLLESTDSRSLPPTT